MRGPPLQKHPRARHVMLLRHKTQVSKERWEEVVKEGAGCTRPYLELDVEAFRAYREGETRVLPKPCCDDPADRTVMATARGRDVLCLGAGGGQQSAPNPKDQPGSYRHWAAFIHGGYTILARKEKCHIVARESNAWSF